MRACAQRVAARIQRDDRNAQGTARQELPARPRRCRSRRLGAEAWASVARSPRDRRSGGTLSPRPPQGSSSSDSLEGQSCDYASKSYDAVVFDVLKVTPEEFAVSNRSGVGAGPAAGCRAGESLPWVSGGEVTALGVGRGSHWSGLFAQVGSNPYAQRRGIVE